MEIISNVEITLLPGINSHFICSSKKVFKKEEKNNEMKQEKGPFEKLRLVSDQQ